MLSNIASEFYQQIMQQRERWIFWLPVFLGMGIVVYFSLGYEPPLRQTGAFVSLSGIGCYLSIRRPKFLLLPFLIFFIIAVGFMLAHFRTINVEAPVLKQEIGPTWIRGEIESLEPQTSGYRLILDNLSIWKMKKAETPEKARINVRTDLGEAKVGDYISVLAKISPPPQPVIPGGYDFARWAFFEQIGAVGFSLSAVEIREKAEVRGITFKIIVEKLREKVTRHIIEVFNDGVEVKKKDDSGSIAVALITGEKGAIRKNTLEAMRNAGLGHLLAISGLHLALITATAFFMVRAILALIPRIALNYNIKKWSAFVALLFGFIYLLISGSPVSAQRAYIMVSLFLLAIMVDRMGSPMRPAIWAALIILILTPESLLTPSFQMSFAAAIALIAAYRAAPWFSAGEKKFIHGGKIKRIMIYIFSLIFSSIIAGAATTPFAIYHFGHYTQYGIISNAVAIPVTSVLIMPAGFLALLLMPVGLDGPAFWLMGEGIKFVVFWAEFVTSLPAAHFNVPSISDHALGIITIGGLWLCFWQKSIRLLGVIIILAGIVWSLIDVDYPDLVVEGNGKLFAIRTETGEYAFSDRRRARYSRDIWQRLLGMPDKAMIIMEIQKDDQRTNCSENACTYNKYGRKMVVFTGTTILETEIENYCNDADVVVILHSADNPCKNTGAVFVGANELSQSGSHVVYITNTGVSVKTVKEERGKRPWT